MVLYGGIDLHSNNNVIVVIDDHYHIIFLVITDSVDPAPHRS